MKWLTIGTASVAAAGLGLGAYFLVRANGLEDDRIKAIEAAGGPSDGSCATEAQCTAGASARADQADAVDAFKYATSIGIATAVGAVLGLVLWRTEASGRAQTTVNVAPSAQRGGGGFVLEGTF